MMSNSPTELPSPPRIRPRRRWVIGGLLMAALVGTSVGVAFVGRDRSPRSAATPAPVSSWMRSHPEVVGWMHDHPGEWTWMREHWYEMTWMGEHWSGMAWFHDHPSGMGGSGRMGAMPMGERFPEMRQWMSHNVGTWSSMQQHWSPMSWWMRAHWAEMQWMYDHWAG